LREVAGAADEVAERYGKHAVSQGTGLHLRRPETSDRDRRPQRRGDLLPGETDRQRINLPKLDIRV
jgi:hypothetical protein